ncbi:MAG: ABC transporter ATP-binding protein [Desulfobacteraceae bacterium]|nr:ABC transporter ATP-binding protein [Desulfobacteraceae bacterium]
MQPAKTVLNIDSLFTEFNTIDGTARAVNDVTFDVKRGEILGIVGESGSGKSVTALSIMRLIRPPGSIRRGRIEFFGRDLMGLSGDEMKDVRGNRISMIFQEPMTSLHPLFTIGLQISEMYIKHMGLSKKEAWEHAIEMLEKVQIPSPEKRVKDYPHQMSGGMRQRVMIAMALSCNPELLIADEPTTALDVTIQAQVIDLMWQLEKEYSTAIMMITHDLGVIAEIAQRVIVMYAGEIVEEAEVNQLFEQPKHPYTRALLEAIPKLGRRTRMGRKPLQEIKGIVPGLYNLPAGCNFYPRCPEARPDCRLSDISLIDLGIRGRVRCPYYQGAKA